MPEQEEAEGTRDVAKWGAQLEGWCWIVIGEHFGCELGIAYCWRIVEGV